MTQRRSEKPDPILELAYLMTFLGFIFMVAFSVSFNPLPLAVSILGFVAGLYLVAMVKYPEEAKYWRKFILDKLDLLFNWSIGKAQELRKQKKRRGPKRKKTKNTKNTTLTARKTNNLDGKMNYLST